MCYIRKQKQKRSLNKIAVIRKKTYSRTKRVLHGVNPPVNISTPHSKIPLLLIGHIVCLIRNIVCVPFSTFSGKEASIL